ncbi:alpha/beta hydrolase fold-domain-containing protein [Xylaria sp. CBS 124048]|nr:alpha/beta hydrolase fold-domain-containing protein [Xylaria sp. CBS 124048]
MTARNAIKEKTDRAELRKAQLDMIWLLLGKLPLFLRLIFSRLFGMSEISRYMDMSTEIHLAVLRLTLGTPTGRSISDIQALTLLDPGVKGRVWVSNAVAEVPPQRGLREALYDAIVSLGKLSPRRAKHVKIPAIVPVEAEWTGYRAGVSKDAPQPHLPEVMKYEAMMKECRNDTTVMFFHGGSFFLFDPSTYRKITRRLAKVTGGRVYSVRYRLAPQHPFPAALLDALVSYFTLLYPPPGSMHEAVPAKNIIFSGDNAGGNLALALTQTLMHLRRQSRRMTWYGAKRVVPLPAGITLLSPSLDIAQSMPSWSTNQKWDYLPDPELRHTRPEPARDQLWPATPRRRYIYVEDPLLLHPLASVHMSRSWAGCPPVWISCGWECHADENKYLVARMLADHVPVVFEEYEAMPHAFAVMMPRLAESARCVQGWARFIAAARKDPAGIVSSYTQIKAKTLEEVEGNPETLTPYGQKEILELARARIGKRMSALSTLSGLSANTNPRL